MKKNMEDQPTPRTDAFRLKLRSMQEAVDFERLLERRLAKEVARANTLQKDYDKLIMELVEANETIKVQHRLIVSAEKRGAAKALEQKAGITPKPKGET